MIRLFVQQWRLLKMGWWDDALRPIIVMPPSLAMVCHQLARDPEPAQDAIDACHAIPRIFDPDTEPEPVLELVGRKRPSGIDGSQNGSNPLGFAFQHFSIVIWSIFLTNKRPPGPVAGRDKTRLFVPGIVDQTVGIGRFLPIIDPVAGDASLKNQIGIAPNGVERVVLHGGQPLKDANYVGGRKMIDREQPACLLARNMYRHDLSLPQKEGIIGPDWINFTNILSRKSVTMYFPTTRVLTVLELLQSHWQMSGPEMARRLEVDIRTVRRYITMLQDLGIPVEAERGRHGSYRLRPGFKLPPLMFTEEEVLAQIGRA